MKRVNFKFKSTALVLLALGLSSKLWGADLKVNDYLIQETFKGGSNSSTFSASTYSSTYSSITWSTGNSDDAKLISYESANVGFFNPSTVPANMTTSHVWMTKNNAGYLVINNIPLHNVAKFQAHWASNNADATIYFLYKFNGDAEWSDGGSQKQKSADNTGNEITVPSGKTSVSIKFTRANNTKNNRIDDIKLKVTAIATSKTISSISVTTAPKTIYTTCETLVVSDWKVTATYSDASTEDVTSGCTFSPANGAELTSTGAQDVTVTHTASSKQTTQSITVSQGARDTYIDLIHDTATQYGDCNEYDIPTCADVSKGSECTGLHYKFIGWSTDRYSAGKTTTGDIPGFFTASGTKNATNTTYYAVWAAEQ